MSVNSIPFIKFESDRRPDLSVSDSGNMLEPHRKFRTFGKTAKINIEERTPKFLYRTKVNNVSRKCIPYIYYTLIKKSGL